MNLRPWVARDTTNRRQVLHQIWCDKIHNCHWSVKTAALCLYPLDTCAPPCLPHLPSVPFQSSYLHTFPVAWASNVPPVWRKGTDCGLWTPGHPPLPRKTNTFPWLDSADFSCLSVTSDSADAKYVRITVGTLAKGHWETFSRALSVLWIAPEIFQAFFWGKKTPNNTNEKLRGGKTCIEWEKTQFCSSLWKPFIRKPPNHISNHTIIPWRTNKQRERLRQDRWGRERELGLHCC